MYLTSVSHSHVLQPVLEVLLYLEGLVFPSVHPFLLQDIKLLDFTAPFPSVLFCLSRIPFFLPDAGKNDWCKEASVKPMRMEDEDRTAEIRVGVLAGGFKFRRVSLRGTTSLGSGFEHSSDRSLSFLEFWGLWIVLLSDRNGNCCCWGVSLNFF